MNRSAAPLACAVACAALALLAHAPRAHAYAVNLASDGSVVRWPTPEVVYHLQLACSDDLEPEVCLAAVRAGFASWADVACADVTFEELGDAPNPKVNLLAGAAPNGKNELVFLEDAAWTFGKNTLGVTAPLHGSGGQIYEADIAFNGYLQTWSIGGGQGTTDLEAVAVHEIGHMIGVQHSLLYPPWGDVPTMTPNIHGQSRDLHFDDEMAACYLYPAQGELACASDDECPHIMSRDANGDEYYSGQMTCVAESGTCGAIAWVKQGIANIGEACEVDENCVGDYYCQPWEQAGGYVCAKYCLSASPDCPDGFTCRPFQSHPKWGACLPDSGVIVQPGEGPLGCASSDVCTDGKLCLPTPLGDKKACTVVCQVDDPDTCPAGYECHQYSADKPTGGCFPPEPEPEPEPDAGPTEPDAGADVGPTPDGEGDSKGADDVALDEGTNRGKQADDGCAGGGGPAGALGWALCLLVGFALGVRRRAR